MREIVLSKGKVALIDDADFDRVNQFKWTASHEGRATKWYAIRRVKINGRSFKIRMHRFILNMGTGFDDPRIVDHINDDGLDNRKDNLQVMDTNGENMAKVPTWCRRTEPCL